MTIYAVLGSITDYDGEIIIWLVDAWNSIDEATRRAEWLEEKFIEFTQIEEERALDCEDGETDSEDYLDSMPTRLAEFLEDPNIANGEVAETLKYGGLYSDYIDLHWKVLSCEVR